MVKKIALPFCLFLFALHMQAQFVGINTTAPQAMLHVKDSNVLFGGPNVVDFNPASNPPVQGAGTRLMWYAQKAALRAGWVEDDRWNKDSIGPYSVALGHSTMAANTATFATGQRSTAYGMVSTAMGMNSSALADYSFAAGYYASTLVPNSVAIGTYAVANAYYTTSIGINTLARANGSTAIGDGAATSGTSSVAIGRGILAKAASSFVAGGYNDTADTPNPTFYNAADRIFQLGNGNPFLGTRANALTVLRNGNHGLGTLTPTARLHVADSNVVFTGPATPQSNPPYSPPVEGAGVRMMWYPQKAAFRAGSVNGTQWDKSNTGMSSIALGENPTASGDRSFAAGYFSRATGFNSTAIGFAPVAQGNYSTSIGNNTVAIGGASIAMGEYARTSGNYATSIGYYTRARSDYSFVTGRYNDSTAANRLFEIGNGTAENDRKNAFTILQNGYTGINTALPAAVLHVADSSVLFSATGPNPGVGFNNPPASGAGRRMMWYAEKSAFRAGYVAGNNWDRANIGDYTFAAGYDTRANSIGAVATGINSTASNFTAVAMGYLVNVTGAYSTGFGYQTTASGYYALAVGNVVAATGSSSVAFGEGTTAKAVGSLVTGRYNNVADNPDAFTPASTDRVFQIGIGTADNNRANAVTVLRNGNVGIGNLNPIRPLSFPATLGEKIVFYPGATGEVGIGVYGNELRIHSDYANAKISFGYQDNAGSFTQTMWLNNNTSVLTVGGTAYPSDERFKKDIQPIQSPLQKLLALSGVEYTMRTEEFPQMNFSRQRQTGLLAQQVEKVMPSAVYDINDQGYKGVDYAKLVPLLVEAVKEQQEQIEELKLRIRSLEKQ